MDRYIRIIKENKFSFKNFIGNWWFFVSSAIYYLMCIWLDLRGISGALAAIVLSGVIGGKIGELHKRIKCNSKKLMILSFVSAVGMCMFAVSHVLENVAERREAVISLLYQLFPVSEVVLSCLINLTVGICAVMALPYLVVVFTKLYPIMKNIIHDIFEKIEKKDLTVLGLIMAVLLVYMFVSYKTTNVFYSLDIEPRHSSMVYSADNLGLLETNVWVNPTAGENDIRQPLFAIFSMGFFAPVYFISMLFSHFANIMPYMYAVVNIAAILLAFWLISGLVENNRAGSNKYVLILILVCMYSSLVFSITPEQYNMAVFWLILFIYAALNKKKYKDISFIGAVGTLTTSAVMFPLIFYSTMKRGGVQMPDGNKVCFETVCTGPVSVDGLWTAWCYYLYGAAFAFPYDVYGKRPRVS